LLGIVRASLVSLKRGIEGLELISEDLEAVMIAID